MLFQTFDDKHDCVLAFQDGKFCETLEGLDLSHTWSYATYLKDRDIQYAQLWTGGHTLAQACPSHLQEELEKITRKLKGIVRSCYESTLNLNELCFYELVPPYLLKDYALVKNQICEHIFNTVPKPPHYDQLLKIAKVTGEVKQQPLDLKLNRLNGATLRERNLIRKLKECTGKITYDAFKTKTGRLTTTPDSFPILTLSKEYRRVVTPQNDWLFELDFNAAELRTILGLLGHSQPLQDLHQWNINNLFEEGMDREAAKKKIFAWLYNPAKIDGKINGVYDREKVKALYYKDNKVHTIYDRIMECDDYHAVNYIIQSTAADILFEQMYEVWKLLENKRSFIKFCNHDSLTIDLATEDQEEVGKIKETFANTRFGQWRVSCTGGKNWGEMKKLNIL